jgi:hypothetical protein
VGDEARHAQGRHGPGLVGARRRRPDDLGRPRQRPLLPHLRPRLRAVPRLGTRAGHGPVAARRGHVRRRGRALLHRRRRGREQAVDGPGRHLERVAHRLVEGLGLALLGRPDRRGAHLRPRAPGRRDRGRQDRERRPGRPHRADRSDRASRSCPRPATR